MRTITIGLGSIALICGILGVCVFAWELVRGGLDQNGVYILVLAVFGAWKAQEIKIGDLHRGVPELRADSRYNIDSAVITDKFSIGVDVMSVIVETIENGCIDHDVMRQLVGPLRVVEPVVGDPRHDVVGLAADGENDVRQHNRIDNVVGMSGWIDGPVTA